MEFAGKKLLVFGDSIIFGSGNGGVGVGEYLAEKFGFVLKKYAVGGARVGFQKNKSWVVEQVKNAVLSGESADVIIFDGFTNDCNLGDGKNADIPFSKGSADFDIFEIGKDEGFSQCFKVICSAICKYFKGAKVIFMRPHKMGRRDARLQVLYGERAVEICKEHGFGVADIYTESGLDTFDEEMKKLYTFDSYGWGTGDATHPNAEGYKKFYLPIIERELLKL